jgi:tetratricopeptide (TPR) repeat protein
LRGKLGGLLIALGFAVVLEIALLTSVVWPLWFGPVASTVVWFSVVLYWLIGALPQFLRGTLGSQPFRTDGVQRLDLFRQAQAEYLRGNWFLAEQRLQDLLATDETDADVQLMLASLYRRLNRADEAERQLNLANDFDRTGKWRWEITRERRRIRDARPGPVEAETTKETTNHAANQAGAA